MRASPLESDQNWHIRKGCELHLSTRWISMWSLNCVQPLYQLPTLVASFHCSLATDCILKEACAVWVAIYLNSKSLLYHFIMVRNVGRTTSHAWDGCICPLLTRDDWLFVVSFSFITGYIQTERMTYCLSRKHQNSVLFLENIPFLYIYVSVDNDTINNSGKYFTCGVCNLENIVTSSVKVRL